MLQLTLTVLILEALLVRVLMYAQQVANGAADSTATAAATTSEQQHNINSSSSKDQQYTAATVASVTVERDALAIQVQQLQRALQSMRAKADVSVTCI
jgi:hypothetical protein